MPLTQEQFTSSLEALFDSTVEQSDPQQLAESAAAYQNLSMHFIEKRAPWLLDHIAFDPVKMGLMLKRFYRDAFGVGQFHDYLSQEGFSDEKVEEIKERLKGLSIRINSASPRKTRVAAAFSLWASTMRPICLLEVPDHPDSRLWRLESTLNFWIATRYLEQFGTIEIGVPGDVDDSDTRIKRIWYDFTFRDIGLSSLEMMYASIFRPSHETAKSGS